MSKELVSLVREFEGRPVTTFRYRGRPAWIAREIGAALEYADDGKALVAMLTREWSDEVQEGSDFVLVMGAELSDLKALLELGVPHTPSSPGESGPIPNHAPSTIVLFESGLHLALLKTNKPVGKRLRRLLVDEVLPQLLRDGQFDPERTVSPQGELQPKTRRPALDREAQAARRLEYRRLALQAANAALYAADHMTHPREADAARREALRLLIGHPLKVAPGPAVPAAPEAPVPPAGPNGLFPVRLVGDVERSRAARLAQEANRQSPFGVQPPLPFSDDPTDPTKH